MYLKMEYETYNYFTNSGPAIVCVPCAPHDVNLIADIL